MNSWSSDSSLSTVHDVLYGLDVGVYNKCINWRWRTHCQLFSASGPVVVFCDDLLSIANRSGFGDGVRLIPISGYKNKNFEYSSKSY